MPISKCWSKVQASKLVDNKYAMMGYSNNLLAFRTARHLLWWTRHHQISGILVSKVWHQKFAGLDFNEILSVWSSHKYITDLFNLRHHFRNFLCLCSVQLLQLRLFFSTLFPAYWLSVRLISTIVTKNTSSVLTEALQKIQNSFPHPNL